MSNLEAIQQDFGDGRKGGLGKLRKTKGEEKCSQKRCNKGLTERGEPLATVFAPKNVSRIEVVLREALLLFKLLWKSCAQ